MLNTERPPSKPLSLSVTLAVVALIGCGSAAAAGATEKPQPPALPQQQSNDGQQSDALSQAQAAAVQAEQTLRQGRDAIAAATAVLAEA